MNLASFWKWRFWKFGIFASVKYMKTWRYQCYSFVTVKTRDFDKGVVPKTSICDDLCNGNLFSLVKLIKPMICVFHVHVASSVLVKGDSRVNIKYMSLKAHCAVALSFNVFHFYQQIYQQFPCSFEFNDRFLITLFEHAYSSQFGKISLYFIL